MECPSGCTIGLDQPQQMRNLSLGNAKLHVCPQCGIEIPERPIESQQAGSRNVSQ
jgi:hypothetical protein